MTDQITDNTETRRLELAIDGQIVFANYKREGLVLFIRHVEAPVDLRGTGAAGRFMTAMTDYARSQGLKLVPYCSYAAGWLRQHPEHHDLLA